jgi:hypothetical protein
MIMSPMYGEPVAKELDENGVDGCSDFAMEVLRTVIYHVERAARSRYRAPSPRCTCAARRVRAGRYARYAATRYHSDTLRKAQCAAGKSGSETLAGDIST